MVAHSVIHDQTTGVMFLSCSSLLLNILCTVKAKFHETSFPVISRSKCYGEVGDRLATSRRRPQQFSDKLRGSIGDTGVTGVVEFGLYQRVFVSSEICDVRSKTIVVPCELYEL